MFDTLTTNKYGLHDTGQPAVSDAPPTYVSLAHVHHDVIDTKRAVAGAALGLGLVVPLQAEGDRHVLLGVGENHIDWSREAVLGESRVAAHVDAPSRRGSRGGVRPQEVLIKLGKSRLPPPVVKEVIPSRHADLKV
jgi:hypothetical protein